MVEEKIPMVVFDQSSEDKVLSSLGLKKNNSKIIDGEKRVLTNQDYEEIESDNFGGILIGSKIAIKKDSNELVKYFVRKK